MCFNKAAREKLPASGPTAYGEELTTEVKQVVSWDFYLVLNEPK